jgi:hypothetical protein
VGIRSLENGSQDIASWSSEASASGNGEQVQEQIHPDSNDIVSLDSDNLESMGSACAGSAE